METSRRALLKVGLITATTAAFTGLSTSVANAAPNLKQNTFTLGVEDGRGGMPDQDYQLHWEVARDERFRRIVAKGRATARPEFGHAVHVEAQGLDPAHEYWYRFHQSRHISRVGHTRTAPALDANPTSLAMSFVSCSQFEHAFFTAYRRLAEDRPELVLHLGDYRG